jgi:hypothetical protein
MFLSSAVRVAFAICGLLFSISLASWAAPQVCGLDLWRCTVWTGTDSVELAAPTGRPTQDSVTFGDSGAVVLSAGYGFDPPIRVENEGRYADTADSGAERRASSGKTQLVADSPLEGNISTIVNGFAVLLVATEPGTRERQNRGAVLDPGV